MKLIFSENAWEDTLYWQKTDKKVLNRINKLIKETKREPFEGVGQTRASQTQPRRVLVSSNQRRTPNRLKSHG